MKLVRMLTMYNEEDIIERSIRWYADQGIKSVIVDNGSTDASYGICSRLIGKGVLDLATYATEEYEEAALLDRVLQLAQTHNPDWLLLADADEFYESFCGGNLKEAIIAESVKGYNAIQFHNMEFWMTVEDNCNEPDIIKRIRHYSYFDSNRFKCYANIPGINISKKLGHAPAFPEQSMMRLSPNKFISRHYKFRSLEQGYRKIGRVRPTKDKPAQNFHYLQFLKTPDFFIIPATRLNVYTEDHNWIIERKFDGNRMSNEEIRKYLGLNTLEELFDWMQKRSL